MAKIITYNVNGIRSALSKGWLEWLKVVDADIVCLQEIKAHPEQLDLTLFENAGYKQYWYPAQKKVCCRQKLKVPMYAFYIHRWKQ